MPETASASRPPPGAGGEGRNTGNQKELIRLLRCSHIFSSTVRDVLEIKLLREVSQLPLTLPQLNLLKLMSLNGQHQAGEVAEFLGVSPPAATKNIDKLERNGLIVRRRSRGDRRATLLSVSPKGRRLVRRYEHTEQRRLSPVLKRFHSEELDRFTELLERFAVSLLEMENGVDGACLRCGAYLESGCSIGRLQGGCPYRKTDRAESGYGGVE